MFKVAQPTSPLVIMTDLFDLKVTPKNKTTSITLTMNLNLVTTSAIPMTFLLLERWLPKVLESTCYNDDDLPFKLEVSNTEIGHLFEHILLEYLCELKISQGNRYASYSGVTNWNWHKEKRGIFHINIKAGIKDQVIFWKALDKAVTMTIMVLRSVQTEHRFTEQVNLHNLIRYDLERAAFQMVPNQTDSELSSSFQ